MANYNLVVDTSNFKPYDIGPALQILHDYRDAYYKLEDQLNKIAEEKGQYIPPEGTKYRDTMDRYNQDFSAVVDDFSKGMNLNNRAAIAKMRQRYLEDITPINRAAAAYNKYQDKLTALGPDAIIGNKSTFDDFYGGNNPAIEYRSAKEIQRTAAGVMQGLDNALMRAPEKAGNIAKQYFILRQQGLDGSQALSTILQHNPMDQQTAGEASQLIQALDNVYDTFNKESFSDDAKGKIWENTVLGAIQGIQAPKYNLQTDHSYESAAQRASREYTETQTAYYRTSKELDEMKKWLDLGYIPQMDEQGNIARDENGNILYEQNIEEAAKRKKQLGSSSSRGGASTPSVSKPPAGYVEFVGSDGKKYAVKNKGSEYYIQLESIIYTQDDQGNWIQVPADETELRTKISNEAKGLLHSSPTAPSPTETEDNKESSPYGTKKSGNPAR